MKKVLTALMLTTMAASSASAQGFMGMQNDPALIQAVNQMAMTLGNACQMGDQASCQNYNYIMQNANAMMGASNACQGGDQMACNYYGQYYQQMDYDYGVFSQQFSAGMAAVPPGGGVNPLGATHQDRMDAIQNFGAQNTQNWQTHMNQMEQNHQTFMNQIGN